MTQRMRTALDFGPMLAWLLTYYASGFFYDEKNMTLGVSVGMIGTTIALAIYYYKTRKIAPIPAVTCVSMLITGGLTIYFDNDKFVMMKPTAVYIFMAAAFLASAYSGKNIMGAVMGPYLKLPAEAWKVFLGRYGFFFVGCAVLNEFLRRSLDFDDWFKFKIFGFTILGFVFMLSQMPFLMKYLDPEDLQKGGEAPLDDTAEKAAADPSATATLNAESGSKTSGQ